MLIYHPAFDIYNCVFRMLQILIKMRQKEVEVDRLRIWDFYITFPNEARKIRFPRDLPELKRIFRDVEPNPYEDLVDPMRIIERMKSFQLSALKCLASYGFIDNEELARNIVKRSEKEIPLELEILLSKTSDEKENILKLVVGFEDLPLFGIAGLKYRTGLIEFKYDPR